MIYLERFVKLLLGIICIFIFPFLFLLFIVVLLVCAIPFYIITGKDIFDEIQLP